MFEKTDDRRKCLYIYILIATFAFFFLMNSPLNPFGNGESGTDSSVFRTIAMMMDNGYMPYKDSFDHKGPLLYLINFVGIKISYTHGIWFIEYLSLFLTATILFSIAKRIGCDNLQSFFSTLISLSLLYDYFQQGNLTEEYAMPFIAVSIYIFLDYMLYNTVNNFRLALCGFSLGAVCLLRANMIGLWMVFCISIFLKCIKEKEYKLVLKFMLLFLVGISVIAVPIVIWLYKNGAIADFWFDYITFNRMYTSGTFEWASIFSRLKSIYIFSATALYQASLIVMLFSFIGNKEKRLLEGTYIFYMIINLFLLAMSTSNSAHYGMFLIPSLLFPIAKTVKYVCKNYDRLLISFISMFLICNLLFIPCLGTAYNMYLCLKNRRQISEVTKELVDKVVENTDSDDKISVYGNFDLVYVLSGRMHATKYSYQTIGAIYPKIMEEYWEELEDEQPKIIVVATTLDDTASSFIADNDYVLIWASINEVYLVYKKIS